MAAHMRKGMAPKKRKLQDMSVDEFMKSGFDSDSSDDSAEIEHAKQKKRLKSQKTKATAASKHKESLKNLAEVDPEFYKFLENEDKSLLHFAGNEEGGDSGEEEDKESGDDDAESDVDEEESEGNLSAKGKDKSSKAAKLDLSDLDDYSTGDEDSSDDDDEDTGPGRVHKPPKQLEVASDDSDEEAGDDVDEKEESTDTTKKKRKAKLITPRMIQRWTKSLETNATMAVLKEVMSALRAAVLQAGGVGRANKYVVKGSTAFNAIVCLCLSHVAPALHKVIAIPPMTDLQKPIVPASDNKKWLKMRIEVKSYLADLLKLVNELSEPSMVNVILKHMHKLVAFYSCFPKIAKVMLKKMISLWSTSEETTRVMAFFCINRLIHIMQKSLLDVGIKQMYIAYVKNSKFTSPTTLPMINFMQRSLVEIFAIDVVRAYQYAFVYIRQLAIHLRNAIISKKTESCQAVYNWQFVHSLGLWVRLLSATHPNDVLEPLIYPLTQTIIGTIKLLPSERYYPLRFHGVRLLTMLSAATSTFIPVLPFLLEVFQQTDFNKQHKSLSFKPFNFACILKLSKSQLQEKSFKDGVVDQLYELVLDQFHVHASSVGFPELALPAILQLKEFLKTCKVANYCKQIRQILDKVDENAKFITNRRKSLYVDLSDHKTIEAWEKKCGEAGTPLGKYYKTWRKLRDRELQHEISAKEQISGDDGLPTIVKPRGLPKATEQDKMEFSALFDTDSEDSDDETRFLPKSERTNKTSKKAADSDSDDYSDFDSDDLEQLAQSADEDDDKDSSGDAKPGTDDDDDDDSDNDNDDIPDTADVVEDFEMSDSD